ncbi:hypothetical protein N2152v2_004449 [Parachlorella kessleri]
MRVLAAQQGSAARPAAKVSAKPASSTVIPRVHGYAALLLSNAGALAMSGMAKAEDALPTISLPDVQLPDVQLPDVSSAGSDIAALFADNPLLVGGGIALLLVPVGIGAIQQLASGGAQVKVTSPARAFEALEQNPKVILVDIRSKAEVKEAGSPDLKSIKRKAVKGEVVVDEAFADKFARLGGLGEESRVLLLDAEGKESSKAAKAVLESGALKSVYVVQGGAEAWKESDLPWKEPGRGLELPTFDLAALGAKVDPKNLGATVETLAEDLKSAPTLTKAGLAAGGLAAAGFLLFNEVEVLLQLVGIVAAGQFAFKLLFAEEREQTLTEIRSLVKDKIAVAEAGDDLKKLATVLLEDTPVSPSTSATTSSKAPSQTPTPAAEPAKAAAKAAAKIDKPAEPAAKPAEPAAKPAAAESNGAKAEEEEVPPNVKEAQEWIEQWKKKGSA